MIKIGVKKLTNSSFEVVLKEDFDYSEVKIYLKVKEFEDFIPFGRCKTNGEHEAGLSLKDGVFKINVTSLIFEDIYDKVFYFAFFDDSGDLIDASEHFKVFPEVNKALKGVSNKLRHDFEISSKFSGVFLQLYIPNLLEAKCAKCWDYELEQKISSKCDCQGERYFKVPFLSKKTKTQTSQVFEKSGQVTREVVLFQTYARLDFTKGLFIKDPTNGEYFEIQDRTVANIGGNRTSTVLQLTTLNANDIRIANLI